MTQPLKPVHERRLVAEKSQRICIDLLHTDIDLAHAFLRLAGAELDMAAVEHALQLIGKAVTAHHCVTAQLKRLPAAQRDEQRKLERDASELGEAIARAQRLFQTRMGTQTSEAEPFLSGRAR